MNTRPENTPPVGEAVVERARFATMPPERRPLPVGRRSVCRRLGRADALRLVALGLVLTAGGGMLLAALTRSPGSGAPTLSIAVTLAVFLLAVWAWTSTRLDDTLVAFLAAIALIVTGVLPARRKR